MPRKRRWGVSAIRGASRSRGLRKPCGSCATFERASGKGEDGSAGKGIETAVLGMKIGRRCEVHVAKKYAKGLQITRSFVEIEVLGIK